ncbi:hypothetical protein Tco_0470831 [Tanacetum coccineum]
MGDKNPIRTLGDYSRPNHEGYQNTIELPDGNNVVSLRSDTIRLVQNGCSFYGLRSEALGWLLEEIRVTWAHLEKKQTRLRLYTKSLEETIIQTVETGLPTIATASEIDQDGIRSITTASEFYLFFVLFVRNSFLMTFMGDKNPIRTLRDYSKPIYEGYQNIIELPEGNNVVPLRSGTIWLVQNGCSFPGLWFGDPNQHLKDFLKLVDSLDLDVANRERTCLRLFQFSLRDQASNWLERLPARSISKWEDLTTHFLA